MPGRLTANNEILKTELIICRRLLELINCRGSNLIVQVTPARLESEKCFGWEAGTRTPIARSRVWSPTIGRPPSEEFEFTEV